MCGSEFACFDNSVCKGLRRLLWHVMPDAVEDLMGIFTRKFAGICLPVGIGAVKVTADGDGGHRDDRAFTELVLQYIILRIAFRQAETPAVIMDHDGRMVRIIECCSR